MKLKKSISFFAGTVFVCYGPAHLPRRKCMADMEATVVVVMAISNTGTAATNNTEPR